MEGNRGMPAGNGYPGAQQQYRQLLKLAAGMEEIKTALRAIRRQLDAEAAGRRGAKEGEKEA